MQFKDVYDSKSIEAIRNERVKRENDLSHFDIEPSGNPMKIISSLEVKALTRQPNLPVVETLQEASKNTTDQVDQSLKIQKNLRAPSPFGFYLSERSNTKMSAITQQAGQAPII